MNAQFLLARTGLPAQTPGLNPGRGRLLPFSILWTSATVLGILVLAEFGAAAAEPPQLLASTNGHAFHASPVAFLRLAVTEREASRLTNRSRAYVRATVREDGASWPDAGLRLKGGSSYRSLDKKPAFAVKFNEFAPDREFHGLTKVLLNNSILDASHLREWLALGLFRDAGVPAQRASHARVRFNDRDLGLYVMLEAVNKRFLKRHFAQADGRLYEGVSRDIDRALEQDGGAPGDQSDLKALLGAAREADPRERWRKLGQRLDMECFLRFMAMEMLVGQMNGYCASAHNYRVYHDPASDKMVFIPHGLGGVFRNAQYPVQPVRTSILTAAILHTPEGRRDFRRVMGELFTHVLRIDVMTNRVAQAVTALRVAAPDPAQAALLAEQGAELCRVIEARWQFVGAELARPVPAPLLFDSLGEARLSGWEPKATLGQGTIDRLSDKGIEALHLNAGSGASSLQWRLPVLVEEAGRYRFKARLKTAGVQPRFGMPGTGAALVPALGMPPASRPIRLTGDNDWRDLECEFAIPPGGSEIVLLCLLEAAAGEAWFDAHSLRLQKLSHGSPAP